MHSLNVKQHKQNLCSYLILVPFGAPFRIESFEGDDGVKSLTLSSFPINESLKQLFGVVIDGDGSAPPDIKSSFSLGKGTPFGDSMRLPVFLQYSGNLDWLAS